MRFKASYFLVTAVIVLGCMIVLNNTKKRVKKEKPDYVAVDAASPTSRKHTYFKIRSTTSSSPDLTISERVNGDWTLNTTTLRAVISTTTVEEITTTKKPPTTTLASSHDVDDFTKIDDFTIEPLVPFYPNEKRRTNPDNSTYENWLAMNFPPNAEWNQEYKTPCYTDYNSGRLRCIPHIYVVGWAKSGTTELYYYLQKHPQLVKGYKETQFLTQFSFWPDHKRMKTFHELLDGFFDNRTKYQQEGHPEKIMYDATATIIYDNWHWKIKQGYAGDPYIPTHTNFHYLRKLHPSAQIVVLMRNPATRALSFYNHGIDMTVCKNANLGFTYVKVPKTPQDIHQFFVESIHNFDECVKKTSLRACCHMPGWESQNWGDPKYFMTLRIGIYYIFLEEVYKNYPPSQVHLIKSEEFYAKPVTVLNNLYRFLNISTSHTVKRTDPPAMRVKKYMTPLVDTYKLLQDFYARYNRQLAKMLQDDKWLEWENELNGLIERKLEENRRYGEKEFRETKFICPYKTN